MKNKRESGEVVVEASIIVTLVFIILSLMFYIGMVMYQQTAMATVANRTATNISQVYSNTLRDPFTGYIDPDNAYQSITYSSMKTDAYMDSVKQKGTAFAQYRLKKSQIIPTDDREVDIQVVSKPNELLKAQIVVSITDTYDVPLVGFFGLDGKISFSATGRADCVDYMEYLSGIEAMSNPDEFSVDALVPDVNVVTFVKDKYSGEFHAAVPVLEGKSIITSNKDTHSSMPSNPKFNGMKFTGWVTKDGKAFSASTEVPTSLTVYGSWDCVITFDPTGGTVNPKTKVVKYMQTTTLSVPNRSGYDFCGWYTQKNGLGEKYISNVTQIKGNITLYAKWKCNHYNGWGTPQKLSNGNCVTRSRWKYTCKRCGYSEERLGAYGGHGATGWVSKKQATCTEGGYDVNNCTICNTTLDYRYTGALGHTWQNEYENDGRCGKGHYLNGNVYHGIPHTTAHGYTGSTTVECYLCGRCAAPWGNGYRWIFGYRLPIGLICRGHNNNDGHNVYDGTALEFKNWHTHG